MNSPAALLVSDDPGWLTAAGEAVVRAGGLVVADCPDAVSGLARAAVDAADLVLVDPGSIDLDRDLMLRLRRKALVVACVGTVPSIGIPVPSFETAGDALAWASTRAGRVGAVEPAWPVVAVFGTRGAPGATTFAIALARRAGPTAALLDLDSRGGCVGEVLGVDGPTVLAAADALAHDAPWAFTRVSRRLAVLAAPSRPWAHHASPVDIGLVIDAVACERTTVIDAGAINGQVDEIATQILARATSVVLVGRAHRPGQRHLSQAIDVLRPLAASMTVVVSERTTADEVAAAVFSGAEEQHQTGRGVEEHQDRHGHSGRRLRLRLRRRGDGQRDRPIMCGDRADDVADHDDDHLE